MRGGNGGGGGGGKRRLIGDTLNFGWGGAWISIIVGMYTSSMMLSKYHNTPLCSVCPNRSFALSVDLTCDSDILNTFFLRPDIKRPYLHEKHVLLPLAPSGYFVDIVLFLLLLLLQVPIYTTVESPISNGTGNYLPKRPGKNAVLCTVLSSKHVVAALYLCCSA